MGWTILSFGQSFLKRQYGLNRIVFCSKFSIRAIWVEPYSLLIKIFQKDYFLLYPDFNSRVRNNFRRQYGSCVDKTVQVVQIDNTVQRDNTGWNICSNPCPSNFPKTKAYGHARWSMKKESISLKNRLQCHVVMLLADLSCRGSMNPSDLLDHFYLVISFKGSC